MSSIIFYIFVFSQAQLSGRASCSHEVTISTCNCAHPCAKRFCAIGCISYYTKKTAFRHMPAPANGLVPAKQSLFLPVMGCPHCMRGIRSAPVRSAYAILPQHCLYFLPEPHGHGSFGYTFAAARFFGVFVAVSSLFVPVTFATCSRSTFCSIFT